MKQTQKNTDDERQNKPVFWKKIYAITMPGKSIRLICNRVISKPSERGLDQAILDPVCLININFVSFDEISICFNITEDDNKVETYLIQVLTCKADNSTQFDFGENLLKCSKNYDFEVNFEHES